MDTEAFLSVAGVEAPALVERGRPKVTLDGVSQRVAGVEAPALVERAYVRADSVGTAWSVAGVEAPALVERPSCAVRVLETRQGCRRG